MSRRPSLDGIIDRVLEATIVGSFTKIGSSTRERLDDWDDLPSMAGTNVLITGGSSGIGKAVASKLLDLGADVTVTSRKLERAEAVASELDEGRPGRASGAEVDTSDFESIRELVRTVELEGRPLDVLIHNAGALTDEYQTNSDGMELTLASHLVGPYQLTSELRPLFASHARVLWMSSGGMYTQGLDVDDLEMSGENYRGSIAYARAKRAQVELVHHLGPLWAPDVTMHAMHPGWVDTDGVSQGLPGFSKIMGPLLRSPESGADTMVWLTAGGADDVRPGSFFLDRRPRGTVYLPGTGTTDRERQRLIEWLDLVTLPAESS